MKYLVFLALTLETVSATGTSTSDFAAPCYGTTLPSLPSSTAIRIIPWGTAGITFANGSTCCSSLDQVRAGIDAVDDQLLELLSRRAAFVREATRFKATRDTVDVPSRDVAVIDGVVEDAPSHKLPQNIAKLVFTAIINASIPFELCIFDEFGAGC